MYVSNHSCQDKSNKQRFQIHGSYTTGKATTTSVLEQYRHICVMQNLYFNM